MIILEWLNNQLLRMEWLSSLVGLLVENVFKLDVNSRLGGSIHFFIYDVIKIFILLSVLIFMISYIQSFFPPERTKKILGRFKGLFMFFYSSFYRVYKCRITNRRNLFVFNIFSISRFSFCYSACEYI